MIKRRTSLSRLLKVLVFIHVMIPHVVTQAATFRGLGDLPGGRYASGIQDAGATVSISGDGTTVVGNSVSENGTEAFRWTPSLGLEGLGSLPPVDESRFFSSARRVSTNGQSWLAIPSVATSGAAPEAPFKKRSFGLRRMACRAWG